MEQTQHLYNIPTDTLIANVLVDIPIDDLLNLCQTSKTINDICQQDRLWELRTKTLTPNAMKSPDISWKQYYFNLLKEMEIPIIQTEEEYIIDQSNLDLINLIKSKGSGQLNVHTYWNGNIIYIPVTVTNGKLSFSVDPGPVTMINDILQDPNQENIYVLSHVLIRMTNPIITRDILIKQTPTSDVAVVLDKNDAYSGTLYMYYSNGTWKKLPLLEDSDELIYLIVDDPNYPLNDVLKQYLINLNINLTTSDNIRLLHGIESIQSSQMKFVL